MAYSTINKKEVLQNEILETRKEIERLKLEKELELTRQQIRETKSQFTTTQIEKPEETGFFASLKKGATLGKEDLATQAYLLSKFLKGEVPEPIPVEASPELGLSRKSIGQFLGRAAIESAPGLAATLGAAGAGAAAGSLIPGPGTVIGGLAGAATGAGTTAALQSFLTRYNEGRLQGLSHEEAIDFGKKAAKISGSINALLAGAGGIGLKSALAPYIAKQTAIQVPGAIGEQVAQNILAQKEGVDPERELLAGAKEAAIGTGLFQTLPLAAAFPKIVKNKFEKPIKPTEEDIVAQMPENLGAKEPSENLTPSTEIPASEKPITLQSVEKQKVVSELDEVQQEIIKLREHLKEQGVEVPAPDVLRRTDVHEPLPSSDDKIYTTVDNEIAKQKIFGVKEKEGLIQDIKRKTAEFAERPLQIIEDKLFDRLSPIKHLGKEMGYKLERENVPYRMARFTNHMTGILESSFFHGTPTWDKNFGIISIDTARPGLIQALEPVLTNPEKLNDFEAYAYARRVKSQDLIQQGKEKNINPLEAESLVNLAQKNPEFEKVFDDVQTYKKQVLDIAEDTGLINKSQRDQWEGIDHIPFYRNIDESFEKRKIGVKRSLVGQKAPIHELTGGAHQYAVFDGEGRLINRVFDKNKAEEMAKSVQGHIEDVGAPSADIIQNLAQNASVFLQASVRNAAANATVNEGIKGGFVKPITKEESKIRGKEAPDVVKTKVDGEDAYFKIEDPLLYSALKSTINPSTKSGVAINTLEWFKNTISKSIVLAPNVQFKIGVKDLIQSRIMGKDVMPSWRQTIGNMVDAYKHEFGTKIDARVIEMMGMGADTGFFKTSPEEVLRRVEEIAHRNNGVMVGFKKGMMAPFKFLEKLSRAQELSIRLSKYDAATKAGANKAEASFEAMDYMDYAMRGSSDTVQFLGKIVPFFSTHLASIHKLGREISHEKFRNRTTKMISVLSTFSMLNAMNNLQPDKSEEDEANNYFALPNYVRNGNMVIDLYKLIGKESIQKVELPRFLMIPKPWEMGQLGIGVPEQIIYTLAGKANTEKNIDFAVDNLMGTLSINPFGNPLVKTAAEQWANKKFFTDTPIVPRARESLEPHLQYGPGTGETAKRIGEFTNISPARIEHAMQGLLGITYTWPIMISDWILTPEKAEKKLYERTFIKDFFKDVPLKQTGFMEEFYQTYREASKAYRTAKTYNELGKVEWLENYIPQKAKYIQQRKFLNKIKKDLKNIYDAQINIDASTVLSSKEKANRLNELNNARNIMMLKVHKTKESIDKGGYQ